MTKYNSFADSGHGWLRVKITELNKLGVADTISEYSYKNGGYAYLEEDSDAPLFLNAKKERNEKVEIVFHQSNSVSKIRSYDSYK
jgi:hypothetical protein